MNTMLAIAYLANLFPARSEPYVGDEIRELRRRGINVVSCSIRRPKAPGKSDSPWTEETIYVYPLRPALMLHALWLCVRRCDVLWKSLRRALFQKSEPLAKRFRAIAHTFLGAYYAALLRKLPIQHVHVHHGYFGSWVAMIAARLLQIDFSMTLHGSDLLLHPWFLDHKLDLCKTCFTISDFNRQHILRTYPGIDPRKVVVQRLGVDCGRPQGLQEKHDALKLAMFTAGRLHPVKGHRFLIRACAALKARGLDFTCSIAGDGDERQHLEDLIRNLDLGDCVYLLGQISSPNMAEHYERANLVVLTSRSEGIPLVLMEAMAREKVVLAPEITGIAELIRDGETGFLYQPGSLENFVDCVEMIHRTRSSLGPIRRAARAHVTKYFNKERNLGAFCERLMGSIGCSPEGCVGAKTNQMVSYENPVLQ